MSRPPAVNKLFGSMGGGRSAKVAPPWTRARCARRPSATKTSVRAWRRASAGSCRGGAGRGRRWSGGVPGTWRGRAAPAGLEEAAAWGSSSSCGRHEEPRGVMRLRGIGWHRHRARGSVPPLLLQRKRAALVWMDGCCGLRTAMPARRLLLLLSINFYAALAEGTATALAEGAGGARGEEAGEGEAGRRRSYAQQPWRAV